MLREAQVAKVLASSRIKPRARYNRETIDDVIFFYFFLLLSWAVLFFLSPDYKRREIIPGIIGAILLLSLIYLVEIVRSDVLRRDVPPIFGSEEESEE